MKHKVETLEGALLDRAVALCETDVVWWTPFAYSTEWDRGGEIIERERIELMFGDEEDPGRWSAYIRPPSHAQYRTYLRQGGATALIAAMRAYVASRMGETVELP